MTNEGSAISQHGGKPGDGVAFLFPGQGMQRIGMGGWLFREVPASKVVLDKLSGRLGLDLAQLCARGPLEQLCLTQYTQPAVFAVGLAAYDYLTSLGVTPLAVAGHSVGELTALCAMGSITRDQAVGLVAERGRLMASAPGAGSMAAIAGLERAAVEEACAASRAGHRVVIAVQNSPLEHIVSGDSSAVAKCSELAVRMGAQRASQLNVSHAFHSPLMAPVAGPWQLLVDQQTLAQPARQVVLNVTGQATQDPAGIRSAMVRHLTEPVEWWQSLRTLLRLGVGTAVICDSGKYMSGLARRAGLRALSFADPRLLRCELRRTP